MPRLVRHLMLCACAAAGFGGIAAALHTLLPLPVPEVTVKLDCLKEHLGDFDTVFIGSSRILHGISPKTFDAAMAAAGKPAHSFNLGISGMWPPESLHMARTLLALRLPRLRRVFIEVAFDGGLPELASPTVRDVYFQDLDEMLYGVRRARMEYRDTSLRNRRTTAWEDLSRSGALFVRNELNIGRLIPTPDFEGNPQRGFTKGVLGRDGDGYFPLSQPITGGERRKLEDGIKAVRARKLKDRPANPLNEGEYARIRDLMARHGVELVLVATPVTTREYHARKEMPPEVKLLTFDDPDRYPELYAPEHRFDADHLNDAGALIWSRELAVAYLAGK